MHCQLQNCDQQSEEHKIRTWQLVNVSLSGHGGEWEQKEGNFAFRSPEKATNRENEFVHILNRN